MSNGALSAPQTLFCLFYAIFWGMIANAQVGWKAFNWPVALAGYGKAANAENKPAWHRLKNALGILSLLPMLVFVVLLWLLDGARPAAFTLTAALQCFLALLAANAAFGVYRIWISRMEANPERFYLAVGKPELGEPGRDKIKLDQKWSKKNLAVGGRLHNRRHHRSRRSRHHRISSGHRAQSREPRPSWR